MTLSGREWRAGDQLPTNHPQPSQHSPQSPHPSPRPQQQSQLPRQGLLRPQPLTLGPYKPPKHPSKVNPKWWASLSQSQKNRALIKYGANRKQYDEQRARVITEAQGMARLAAAGQTRDLQLAQAITDSTAKVKSMMVERLQVW